MASGAFSLAALIMLEPAMNNNGFVKNAVAAAPVNPAFATPIKGEKSLKKVSLACFMSAPCLLSMFFKSF